MVLKVWQWGTEIGTCYHYGSYVDITPSLINELSKYDFDLEALMVEHGINYKLIQPVEIVKSYKVALGLHFHIDWDGWYCPNSGTINGHYFYYKRNHVHGDYIELIFNHQPYFSFSDFLPDYVQPYFAYIWQELKETGNIDFPKEISLGSKVAARLPDGYKAYRVNDDDAQCKVARSKEKYCYIKKFRDCEYYTSFSTNWGLHPSIRSSSLEEAVAAVEKVLEMESVM